MEAHRKSTSQKIESVLITGAGGFLGRELLRQLSKLASYKIFALTSKKEKIISSVSNREHFSCYNMQEFKCKKLPWQEIDAVIHCAFARTLSGQELASSLCFTNDLFKQATANNVRAIINISSQGVYGSLHQPLWSEETPVAPNTMYTMAKYSSELLCAAYGNQTCKTNLRLASLSGGAEGLKSEVISKFVNHALKGEPIRIVGGNQIFSYMDVRYAAAGIIALLTVDPQEWHEVYNLGSKQSWPIIEIAGLVAEAAKTYSTYPVKIEIEETDIFLNVGMNSNLFYKDTRWEPQYGMKDVIESLFEYLSPKEILSS